MDIRQANDVEEYRDPIIFDIIDPTNAVSANSSLAMSVTTLENINIDSF